MAAGVADQTIAADLVAIADDFSARADEIDPSLVCNGKATVDGSTASR